MDMEDRITRILEGAVYIWEDREGWGWDMGLECLGMVSLGTGVQGQVHQDRRMYR